MLRSWVPFRFDETTRESTKDECLSRCGAVRGKPTKQHQQYQNSFTHPRSGELRTQKLKSHLVRTQSLHVLPLKPGVGQYIAIQATLTARDFFLAYFYTSGPFTCIFSKTSPDFSLCWPPQWGAADAEIKVLSGENTELKRSPFQAWSRSVYSHTCYAYCQGFLPCLFLPFQSIHLHFFQNLSQFFPVLACRIK